MQGWAGVGAFEGTGQGPREVRRKRQGVHMGGRKGVLVKPLEHPAALHAPWGFSGR